MYTNHLTVWEPALKKNSSGNLIVRCYAHVTLVMVDSITGAAEGGLCMLFVVYEAAAY